ncbi:SDR family oxidoreductase [Chitinibacter fontanus]|uniref:SDR family oxidoreductase n=1 Tax=Chitinibacter fontanus TaxID=1737446 RepID=A0A7D5V909_9NEIS|nr:SDR family oxidoreductase [Chitinibacter fontanus]QLI81135.1 SDR family oxidoreductase [Chitinibacter fontanus]
MKILVVGAGRGLGRAFVEGLAQAGDTVIGVSRTRPSDLELAAGVELQWIAADLSETLVACNKIEQALPEQLDVVICNVGIWEEKAFSHEYDFLADSDEQIIQMMNVNLTSTILLLKRLIPRLLKSTKPQLILTGSTSALARSGRPEVAFGASKFGLNGIADALREGFRDHGLAVTCLQIGDLNTEDAFSVPVAQASQRGHGKLIPVHDVVKLVQALLQLSPSSYVRELVLPPILDQHF